MWISINYDLLIKDLLPDPILNRYDSSGPIINQTHLDWLYLMNYNVKDNDIIGNDYYDDSMWWTQHNGQLMTLEHHLNNYYLPNFPIGTYSIYIEDGPSLKDTFIYRETESIPIEAETYIYAESEGIVDEHYIYAESEDITEDDFVVYVEDADYNVYVDTIDKAVKNFTPATRIYSIQAY